MCIGIDTSRACSVQRHLDPQRDGGGGAFTGWLAAQSSGSFLCKCNRHNCHVDVKMDATVGLRAACACAELILLSEGGLS